MELTRDTDAEIDDTREEYDLEALRTVARRGKFAARFGLNPADGYVRTSAAGPQAADDLTETTRVFRARMDSELAPIFHASTVPIYREHDQVVRIWGTGTLFDLAGLKLLVTASHVTDACALHGDTLTITDLTIPARGIPLEGRLHSERHLDISVMELAESVVSQIPHRRFLSIHQADRRYRQDRPGWFYVYGWPNCWSTTDSEAKSVHCTSFMYGSSLYTGYANSFDGYDPDHHLLIELGKQNHDPSGRRVALPGELKGTSGCSIWQAYFDGISYERWTTDDAMIVAVQTGVHDGQVIRGTRWWVVGEVLKRAYPELEHVLELYVPLGQARRSHQSLLPVS